VDTIQQAFAIAQDLRTDPFAIKRKMQETPDIQAVPIFAKAEIAREHLIAKSVIGFGQARRLFYQANNLYLFRFF
jgi:hypothetical protein